MEKSIPVEQTSAAENCKEEFPLLPYVKEEPEVREMPSN